MNLERFLRDRRPSWNELESMVGAAKRRPERLGADGVRRMGTLYRTAAADLALARRRFPLDPAVTALEDLVGRARNLVYDTEARRESLPQFFANGYWRRVRERPVPLLVAAVLLFGSAGLSFAWAASDPGSAGGLVPAGLRSVTEPRPAGGLGLSPGASAAFSSAIFTNNIRVSFLAFAGGILVALGTGALLAYNGMILGVVGGLAASAGNGTAVLRLVAPHGVLELGTVPWFILAGLVEGLVTPLALPTAPAVGLGVALAAAYWSLVVWRGSPVPVPALPTATGGLAPSS